MRVAPQMPPQSPRPGAATVGRKSYPTLNCGLRQRKMFQFCYKTILIDMENYSWIHCDVTEFITSKNDALKTARCS